MEERWVEFGEIIGEENEKAGKFGNFGSLLNEDGKLGANWVRHRAGPKTREGRQTCAGRHLPTLADHGGHSMGATPKAAAEGLGSYEMRGWGSYGAGWF